jgi:hypothetical protein
MKRFIILAVAAGAVFGFTSPGNAHVGDIVYPIYELPTSDLPDIFDGTLEDWEDVLPGTALTHDDFTPLNVGEAAGIDPEDSAYRVYLAWHSAGQHVYAGVERIDNVYINTYEGGNVHILAAYDDVEFHLDGDHTGGQYNFWLEVDDYSEEEFKLLQNLQAQQYVIIAESPDGQIIGYQGNGLGWAIDPPYTDAAGTAFGEDPTTTIMEFYVTAWDEINWQGPHLSRRSELVGGKIIGLQVTIADYDAINEDGGPVRRGFHTLSGQDNTWIFAERFVDAELIPCDTGDCGAAAEPLPTAVREDSWGRIKATFR